MERIHKNKQKEMKDKNTLTTIPRSGVQVLLLIVLTIIIMFFTMKSCNKQIPPITKTDIQYIHTSDSILYQNTITDLKNELSILNASKNTLKENYNNLYKQYKGSLDGTNDISIRERTVDTIVIDCDEVLDICNDLVIEQDLVIDKQKSIIEQDSIYINKQESTITNQNILLNTSNELLKESNDNLLKSNKKLKRTRKIGIVGFFTGIGIGIIGALSIK